MEKSIIDITLEGFNYIIAEDMLRQVGAPTDEETVRRMLIISPNPWDAGILYNLLELAKKL